MKMPCGEFEIVKDCAWYILRRVSTTLVLFRSFTRKNVTDHYENTYKPEEKE